MKTATKRKKGHSDPLQRFLNAIDRMIVAARQAEAAKRDLLKLQNDGDEK